MPTAMEELMVRRVLTRRHVAEPDVEEAWRQMSQAIDEVGRTPHEEPLRGSEPMHSNSSLFTLHSSLRRIGLTLVGVAAAACLVLILWPVGKSILFPRVELITAVSQESSDVMITTADGEELLAQTGETLSFVNESQSPATGAAAKARDLVVYTPRGTTCELTLPDGTRAWLNGQSRITFPEEFSATDRSVRASGEIYFEVVKDASRPFRVETKYMTTTVKGTSFNLRAYSPTDASVVLTEGIVEVAAGEGEPVTIEPGQMARLSDGGLQVSAVDTYPLTQWKEGFFYFNDNTMREIMMELGRWYNVNVVFEKPRLLDSRLHFVADHYESVDEIIGRLGELGAGNLTFDGETITVK